jgi:hypothetical protein
MPRWKIVLKRLNFLGYHVFANGQVREGESKKGNITLVSTLTGGQMIAEVSTCHGCAVAVKVHNTLLVNAYVWPGEEHAAEFAATLQEWVGGIAWSGKMLWCGDWNEEFEDSCIAAAAGSHGLWPVPNGEVDCSRWEGRRLIDFFLTNAIDHADALAGALSHKISDHKIISLAFGYECMMEEEQNFKKQMPFLRPLWVDPERWKKLFEEAFKTGEITGWQEACARMEKDKLSPDGFTPQDQFMVDYAWELVTLRLLWVMKHTFFFALLEIPEGYDNLIEIRRVEHLANKWMSTRSEEPCRQERQFHAVSRRIPMAIRKSRNRLGRLLELKRHVSVGRIDEKTRRMLNKLKMRGVPSVLQLDEKIKSLENQIKKYEQNNFHQAIDRWKHSMRYDQTANSHWLTRKKISYYPSVGNLEERSCNKQQATAKLFDYWTALHDSIKWTGDEELERQKELGDFLEQRFGGVCFGSARPMVEDFIKAASGIKGCPGLDQWTYQDLKLVDSCKAAATMIWNAMGLWEELGCTPTVLQHLRLVFIPKDGAQFCKSIPENKLRPLTVFSCWWRAWSSTWNHSRQIWNIRERLPDSMAGSVNGHGPEVMAAIYDTLFKNWGYIAALDFSHCFDTINLNVLHGGLLKGFPPQLHAWINCLFNQWKASKRWMMYDGHVHGTPYQSNIGIPQGDAASPLILCLLLCMGFDEVQQRCPGDVKLFQGIYMDDRTLISNSIEVLREAVFAWQQFAERFHLLENPEKTQWGSICPMDEPGFFRPFVEVLGALIGNVSDAALEKFPKLTGRMQKAKNMCKRVGCLPIVLHEKIRDLGMYAKSVASYGWVSLFPSKEQMNSMDNCFWRAAGRFHYAVRPLRSLLAGVHMEFGTALLLRWIKIWYHKRQSLRQMGEGHLTSLLDVEVMKGLEDLGWFRTGALWQHEVLEDYFEEDGIGDRKEWQKIAHLLRQSMRWKHYDNLKFSNRHEFKFGIIPDFSEERINLIRKLASKDGSTFSFAIGAPMSAKVKSMAFCAKSCCPVCHLEDPHWDHIWSCCVDVAPPDDIMLRRFLWPRNVGDLELCERFRSAMSRINDQMGA